ncbi:MAG: hypothetical protein AB7G44_03200 [Bacteroidia bacterium]
MSKEKLQKSNTDTGKPIIRRPRKTPRYKITQKQFEWMLVNVLFKKVS